MQPNHDSSDHDWETCAECVEQAKQVGILGPDAVPHDPYGERLDQLNAWDIGYRRGYGLKDFVEPLTKVALGCTDSDEFLAVWETYEDGYANGVLARRRAGSEA